MNVARTLCTAASWLVFAGALSSCAGLQYSAERAAELPASNGMIVFRADVVGGKVAKRIQYSDNLQRVDYALFKSADSRAQGEFIYMERPYSHLIAFNFPYTIRDKVAAWNLSKGQPVAWEKAVLMNTRMGEIFFRPYQLTALNRQCFGVSGEWDVASDDPELRNTRIMFGYFCGRPGAAMAREEMLALVERIGIRGVSEKSVDYAEPVRNFYRDVTRNFKDKAASARAIELAQGINKGVGNAANTGISEFPFRYAEYYGYIEGNTELD